MPGGAADIRDSRAGTPTCVEREQESTTGASDAQNDDGRVWSGRADRLDPYDGYRRRLDLDAPGPGMRRLFRKAPPDNNWPDRLAAVQSDNEDGRRARRQRDHHHHDGRLPR